jgi:all-trans-8'-apo-beta-carotenal 15,15'-oxygenase
VFPFLFTSAHPVVDPDRGCLWTVKLDPDLGRSFVQAPTIVRWDGDGARARTWPVVGAEVAGSMHTISQTQNWLILSDSGNFKADPGAIFGGDKTVSIDDEINLYLVRKEEIDRTPSGEPVSAIPFRMGPPPGHFYGQWDDTGGSGSCSSTWTCSTWASRSVPATTTATAARSTPRWSGSTPWASRPRPSPRPPSTRPAPSSPTSRRSGTSGRGASSSRRWTGAPRASPPPRSTTPSTTGAARGAITRRALDFYADRIDEAAIPTDDTPGVLVSFERGSLEEKARWEYPDTTDFVSSPTFAPRLRPGDRYAGPNPGGHDGYVVVPVQNDRGFRVEVFDAANVGAGPVAVASAPGGRTVRCCSTRRGCPTPPRRWTPSACRSATSSTTTSSPPSTTTWPG